MRAELSVVVEEHFNLMTDNLSENLHSLSGTPVLQESAKALGGLACPSVSPIDAALTVR